MAGLEFGTAEDEAADGGEQGCHLGACENPLLDALDRGVHVVQFGAGIAGHGDGHAALVHRGQEDGRSLEQKYQRQDQGRQQAQQQPAAARQQPGRQPHVSFAQGVQCLRRESGWAANQAAAGAECRNHGNGHHQRGEDGRGDGDDEFPEQQADEAADEQEGQDGRQVGGGGGGDGAGDFRCRVAGGRIALFAFLLVAGHVLEHDDGAVHQHAHAHGQAAEGHDVQGQAGEGHDDEGHEDGQGDGQADDQGAGEIAEEQPHHQHGQHRAAEHRQGSVVQRLADEHRLIGDHRHVDVVRNHPLLSQPGQALAHGVHHCHGIGARLLLDGELDGRLAVEAHPQAFVLVGVENPGHVAQARCRAGFVGIADG